MVFNKADQAHPAVLARMANKYENSVAVSAKDGAGLDRLADLIESALKVDTVDVELLVPYTRSDLVAKAHDCGTVISVEHTENGTLLAARVPQTLADELQLVAC
jgi:GTP-binding protein HflX